MQDGFFFYLIREIRGGAITDKMAISVAMSVCLVSFSPIIGTAIAMATKVKAEATGVYTETSIIASSVMVITEAMLEFRVVIAE